MSKRLDPETRTKILQMRSQGKTYQQIADTLSVSRGTVQRVCTSVKEGRTANPLVQGKNSDNFIQFGAGRHRSVAEIINGSSDDDDQLAFKLIDVLEKMVSVQAT